MRTRAITLSAGLSMLLATACGPTSSGLGDVPAGPASDLARQAAASPVGADLYPAVSGAIARVQFGDPATAGDVTRELTARIAGLGPNAGLASARDDVASRFALNLEAIEMTPGQREALCDLEAATLAAIDRQVGAVGAPGRCGREGSAEVTPG